MLSALFLYTFISVLLALVGYWYYVFWFKFLGTCTKLQYFPPWPVIGNALEVLPLSEFTRIMEKFTLRLGKTFKGLAAFDIIIATSDEKLIELISTSKDLSTKAQEYDTLRPWLNDGLLLSTGTKWLKRRRLLTPSFHFNILEDFISIFNSCGAILVDKLRKEVDKGVVDVHHYITLCSLDVIYESTMGVKVDAQLKENSEYVRAVKSETRIAFRRFANVLKRVDFLYKLSRDFQKEKKAIKILHDTTDKIIVTRRDLLLSKSKENARGIEKNESKKRRSFLDILLEGTIDGKPLTNLEIREEVDTFLFEGHDTTTSAITFALYELSINPRVQAKAVEELQSIFGNDRTKGATLNDLQEMKYLDMVIKEALRKYPSVPILGRKCTCDVEYDGMTIPKGTSVAVMPYILHRNPEVFPHPERFEPERFLPDNKLKIGPYAYIPFSAGYRNCIGQKFAILEMKALLASVLNNFELLPAGNFQPKLSTEIVLRSSNGILMKLKNRT